MRIKSILIFITIIISILLLVRLALFEGPVVAETPLPTSPIIDMHVHTAGLGYGGSGCFISDEMQSSYKFSHYLGAFDVTQEQMAEHGDQLVVKHIAETIAASKYVDGAVLLALDGVIDKNGQLDRSNTQVYIPNEFIAEQTALYPSLYFGASINPYRHDALTRLEQVKKQGAKLIKWLPNIQHIDPADEALIPFYKKMKALNLPLLTHTGQERSFSSAIDEYGDPERLKLPLSLGVTVIAAHIATTGENEGEDNYQRVLAMFDKYPTLYADISSLTQVNKLGYLNKALVEPHLAGRLIYGSDFPLVNTPLVKPYYFPLNLTLEQMREVSKVDNPVDRDVLLKQKLGVSTSTFSNSAKLLNITPDEKP